MNIYVHIPFCRSKCAYCAFLSNQDIKKKDAYLEALAKEIREKSLDLKDKWAETIYIGGGTPSLLETEEIGMILAKIGNYFKKPIGGQEVTIETNPEDITPEKLNGWRKLKINRISIGVQTLNDDVRGTIGRRLTADEVIERIKLTINYFSNISVDLIAGLPGDDVASFQEGIKRIYKAGVNHISLYDLELDNDCQIAKNPKDFKLLEEKKRDKFLIDSWRTLERLGYEQYEISNFSYDKKYSKHNWAFWNNQDYIGFGLSAASRINNKITTNTADMTKYLKGSFVENENDLTWFDQVELNMMLQARLNRPISDAVYFYEKGTKSDLTPVVAELTKEGLLDKKLILTPKGRLLYNQVIEKLLVY